MQLSKLIRQKKKQVDQILERPVELEFPKTAKEQMEEEIKAQKKSGPSAKAEFGEQKNDTSHSYSKSASICLF